MGGRMAQERCILISRQTRIKAKAMGTFQMDILMIVGLQRTGDRPMAAYT